jgi:hypothetical protein
MNDIYSSGGCCVEVRSSQEKLTSLTTRLTLKTDSEGCRSSWKDLI